MTDLMALPSAARRTILVVDDDAKIVTLVRTYLEREGFGVVEARDGRAALDVFASSEPSLVVLDLMLPGLDGLEVCRILRRDSDTPILMLSARSAVGDRIRGLEEGADDYLPKPFSPAELVVRVKALLRRAGGAEAGASILVHGDLRVDPSRHEVRRGERLVPLTYVEFRLLERLLTADGRVLSRDQLMDAAYGDEAGDVLDRTIDVHIGRLRDKLGDDADRPRYIATVRGVGYRAAPADEDATA
ncbi:MAG: response regulator transcription factor [Candidatus Limnocylindrales bacterium]